MSLLADLLAKIKQPQETRQVPPNLKNIVQSSSRQSPARKRLVLLSGIFLTAVIAGIALVYFVRPLLETESTIQSTPSGMVAKRDVQTSTKGDITNDHNPENTTHSINNSSRSVKSKLLEDPHSTVPLPDSTLPAAEAQARASNKSNPEDQEVRSSVQKSNTNQKDSSSESIKLAETQKKANPSSRKDSYLYSARKMEMKGNYLGALTKYKDALELDKDNFIVLNSIAYMYLQLNLLDDAIDYSLMALNINKGYVPALVNLAIANARSENFSDAEKYLYRANSLDPDNDYILINLAILNERQEKYEEALKHYTWLTGSGNAEGFLGKARIYEKLDKVQKALDIYRRIISSTSFDHKTRSHARKRIAVLLKIKRDDKKESN